MSAPFKASPFEEELTARVLLAQGGDVESLAWLIARLSPVLRVKAELLLRDVAQPRVDADDLVDEVWLVTLLRLRDLRSEAGHLGRTLMGFLSTTLLNKVSALRARRRPRSAEVRPEPKSSVLTVFERALGERDPTPSSVLCQHEAEGALRQALDELSQGEREVVVLRALEQRSNEEVAEHLGLTPAGATRRFKRALARLRKRMPASLFAS
ncbi:MAG TPA: sigma-70 family RNA polymerase sigma factor [Planctomycetota bacterium]